MKNWELEGKEKFENLLKKIESHPLTTRIREEEAAVAVTARQQAAGQIEALRKQQAETGARKQAVAAEKERAFLKAKADYEVAGSEYNRARAAVLAENASLESKIRLFEDTLFETADPRIDETIQFFREKLDWLRSPGRFTRIAGGAERNIFSETVKVTAESNRAAILAALDYCQHASRLLEAMKLEPKLDLKRIEAMKAEIPSIDNYSESTGVNTLPGLKPPDSKALLKSEDQQAWELSKLDEKIKKLMTRRKAA